MSAGAAQERVLHLLTGCTAVGKTQWALAWAERNGAEIISCDSLLFYRGMDVGTAKPTESERRRVRHHLVDIREVSEPMNVAAYSSLALGAARDIASRGRRVLVVGGSGFYLRSFLAPVAAGPEIPAAIRERVASVLSARGLSGLVAELCALNPAGLGRLDTANPRRVASALERCLASGRTLADLALAFSKAPHPFEGWTVRLARMERAPADLEARIHERTLAMLRLGLVDEVRRLLGAGLQANPSASRAIGYRETIDVVEGRAAEGSLAGAIERDTRALVKKQRTWFRTQLPAHAVLDACDPSAERGLFLA